MNQIRRYIYWWFTGKNADLNLFKKSSTFQELKELSYKQKLDQAKNLLNELSKRHEWQPGFGECMCESHRKTREWLNKNNKGEK